RQFLFCSDPPARTQAYSLSLHDALPISKPIVLVASGTGFAPIKAVIEAAFKKGVSRPMTLYWGARRPKDLYLNGLAERWVAEHRSEEHTSELQSRFDLVCRLLLEKKNTR